MKFPEQQHILAHHCPHVILQQLRPYVTEARQQRIEQVIQHRLNSIQLALECPSDINNAFAAIRTAEVLGVTHIHLIAPEGTSLIARHITQGASYWVSIHYYDTLADFLTYVNLHQLYLVGGVVTATTPLAQVSVTQPLCIFMGNEHRGLSDAAQQACHLRYVIPMVGMTESMNLSVSAAISLYDVTQRKRAMLLPKTSDLSSQEQEYLRAHYFLNSVSERFATRIFS